MSEFFCADNTTAAVLIVVQYTVVLYCCSKLSYDLFVHHLLYFSFLCDGFWRQRTRKQAFVATPRFPATTCGGYVAGSWELSMGSSPVPGKSMLKSRAVGIGSSAPSTVSQQAHKRSVAVCIIIVVKYLYLCI